MPNRIRLTDIAIKSLKPNASQTTYWDDRVPAFGVRVGRRTKTFVVVRDGGHRIKIGRYPAMTLFDARQEAKRLLLLAEAPQPSSPTISASTHEITPVSVLYNSPRSGLHNDEVCTWRNNAR